MVMAWATKTTLVEDIIMDHRTTKTKRFFIMDHSSGCRIISGSHGAKEPWVYVTWHWCSWRGYLVTLLAVISLQSPGTRDPVNDTSAQMHSLNLQWCNYFYLNILYVTGQFCKILAPTILGYIYIEHVHCCILFPGGSNGKESICIIGYLGSIPESRRPPGRKKKRQPTPIFLPGKFQGQRSLVGYSTWGRMELDMTEQLIHIY